MGFDESFPTSPLLSRREHRLECTELCIVRDDRPPLVGFHGKRNQPLPHREAGFADYTYVFVTGTQSLILSNSIASVDSANIYKLNVPIVVYVLQGGFNLIEICKVPFSKMFSPTLVPKPKDWGPHIDIIGALYDEVEENNMARDLGGGVLEDIQEVNGFKPSNELVAFLEGHPPLLCARMIGGDQNRGRPVFLGFGSMVMGKKEVEQILKTALRSAAMAGVRLLVQSGWGDQISREDFYSLALEATEYAKKINMVEEVTLLIVHFHLPPI